MDFFLHQSNGWSSLLESLDQENLGGGGGTPSTLSIPSTMCYFGA